MASFETIPGLETEDSVPIPGFSMYLEAYEMTDMDLV